MRMFAAGLAIFVLPIPFGFSIIDQTVRNTLAEEKDQSSSKPKGPALERRSTANPHPEKEPRDHSGGGTRYFFDRRFPGGDAGSDRRSGRSSKPNLLYYFPSKEAIYTELLSTLLDTWLDPLRALDGHGDPIDEITGYVLRKLEMSRDFPRESRLFANEIVQGAPRILDQIEGPLRDLVDQKAALMRSWSDQGRIADIDPHHLIFSIWATTQHYADFNVQVRGILGARGDAHFKDAATFLTALFRRALTPGDH